jgi:hypothetical protein
VLFDKNSWTPASARKWLKAHAFKSPAVESGRDYLRFRQAAPTRFQKATFRTITFSEQEGIKAVIAVPKKGKVKKNPSASSTPRHLADIADARRIELEDDRQLRFPVAGFYALATNASGNALWIFSRKRGTKKTVTGQGAAKGRFETFTGFEADDIALALKRPTKKMHHIGLVHAIVYRSDKFSRKRIKSTYYHKFDYPPKLAVDDIKNPSFVAITGGRFRVTERGIVG